MTQALRQSIEILQMSSQELTEFVNQEAESNPLIQVEYSGGDTEEPASPAIKHQEQESREMDEDGQRWEERLSSLTSSRYDSSGSNDDDNNLEKYAAREKTLKDHLEEQLYMDIADPVQRIIGLHLIDLVDDSGYLKEEAAELHKQLGCSQAQVEEVIQLLQRFDPAGVFARSLAECLELQLRERNRFDPAMELLLQNLDLLARKDLKNLQRICGVDADDIADMVAEIKALSPKPGLKFSGADSAVVVPDVLVTKRHDKWHVELNIEAMPRVLVNNGYFNDVRAKVIDKNGKKYLSDTLSNASWLVKAVEQRATNILKIAAEIVNRQQDFLKYGVTYLKPMVLKDVAQAVGVHESTVSRVTSNKYLLCPLGMYEMKYFFTSGIGSAFGGDNHSSAAVKHKIKRLVEAEDPASILSDDEIAEILHKDGMDIARRTVAKYREAVGIGSSVQRRREKGILKLTEVKAKGING